MSSIQIDVPKNHPGLQRLLAATRKLPNVRMVDGNGVELHKQGLSYPGVYDEFFDALCDVLGEEQVDAIVEALTRGEPRSQIQPSQLMTVAKGLLPAFGMGGLLGDLDKAGFDRIGREVADA